MPKITYIEHDGREHVVEVKTGLSVMEARSGTMCRGSMPTVVGPAPVRPAMSMWMRRLPPRRGGRRRWRNPCWTLRECSAQQPTVLSDPGQGRSGRPDRAPAREPALTQPPERRFEPRRSANARALIVAQSLELPCVILDRSARGLKVRMDRALALPARVIVIDLEQAQAIEAELAWSKGVEAGLKEGARTSLRGLVPSRLAAARAAWMRAGGR